MKIEVSEETYEKTKTEKAENKIKVRRRCIWRNIDKATRLEKKQNTKGVTIESDWFEEVDKKRLVIRDKAEKKNA